MIDADGGRCTANFLFRGSDGRNYLGTAGHCTLESNGEIVYRPGEGPKVKDSDGRVIGEIGYAILGDRRDFALVRVGRGIKAKASMCFFGGPSGMYKQRSSDPITLNYYGNGTAIGNLSIINQPVVPARSAIAPDSLDRDVVFAHGAASPGDSGAGVTEESTRQAVGVLIGMGSEGIWITRLPVQVKLAERSLGIDLRMRNG